MNPDEVILCIFKDHYTVFHNSLGNTTVVFTAEVSLTQHVYIAPEAHFLSSLVEKESS